MSNLSILNSIVDNRYNTYDVLHRKYGIVKKSLSFAKAIVTVEDKDLIYLQNYYSQENFDPDQYNGTRDLTLLNKTGSYLKSGDPVWIYYWSDITSGYIALKAGKTVEQKAKVNLDKVAVMPFPTEGNVFSSAKIYPDYIWKSELESRRLYIDDYNNLTFGYNGLNPPSINYNMFLVNGFPTVYVDYLFAYYGDFGTSSDFAKQQLVENLKKINPKLYSRVVLLNAKFLVQSLYEYKYDYDMYSAQTVNNRWRDPVRFEATAIPYLSYAHLFEGYKPAIKATDSNGNVYRIAIGTIHSSNLALPTYSSIKEAVANTTMMAVTDCKFTYDAPSVQKITMGIAVKCRYPNEDKYSYGLMRSVSKWPNTSNQYGADYMNVKFNNPNEYYYALCVR